MNTNQLVTTIEANWKKLAIFIALFTFLGLLLSLSINDSYKSTSVLLPSKNLVKESARTNNFIGSALGVTVGQSTLESETLKSSDFFRFLLSQGLDPTELFIEHKTYDQELVYSVDFINTGLVDEKKIKTDKFLVVAHNVYLGNLNITPFKNEDFVTISFSHSSPEIAYKWLNSSILELNRYLAQKTNLKASRSIEFLNQQLSSASSVEVRISLSDLLKQEIKKSMLSTNEEEFAYEFVQSPEVPSYVDFPNRILIIVLFFLISIFLSTIYLVFKTGNEEK